VLSRKERELLQGCSRVRKEKLPQKDLLADTWQKTKGLFQGKEGVSESVLKIIVCQKDRNHVFLNPSVVPDTQKVLSNIFPLSASLP
jgi:hypothetical protein